MYLDQTRSFNLLDLNAHKTSRVLVWISTDLWVLRWFYADDPSCLGFLWLLKLFETRCGLYVVVVVNPEEKIELWIHQDIDSVHSSCVPPPSNLSWQTAWQKERVTSKVGQVWETTAFMETHAVKSDGTLHLESFLPKMTKVWNNFSMFLKEVSSAHQGCIYPIKTTLKTMKYYYYLKQLFSMWICVKL